MTENIDFLNPRLVGDRFNGHSIPLEVLKDFFGDGGIACRGCQMALPE